MLKPWAAASTWIASLPGHAPVRLREIGDLAAVAED